MLFRRSVVKRTNFIFFSVNAFPQLYLFSSYSFQSSGYVWDWLQCSRQCKYLPIIRVCTLPCTYRNIFSEIYPPKKYHWNSGQVPTDIRKKPAYNVIISRYLLGFRWSSISWAFFSILENLCLCTPRNDGYSTSLTINY